MSVNDRLVKSELAKHEAVIERGLRTTIEVGLSMKAIRDNRLYAAEYDSFDSYIKNRWEYTRQRAYQLIEAAEVDANLSTIVGASDRPQRETHLREVAKAPAAKQAEVVRKAVERAAEENRKPTARDYKKVVGELVLNDPVNSDQKPAPALPKGKQLSTEDQVKANRKLVTDYIAKAVNAIDDYHAVKPHQNRRAEIVRLLQQAGEKLW